MRFLTKTAGAAIVAAAFGLTGPAAHAVTTSALPVTMTQYDNNSTTNDIGTAQNTNYSFQASFPKLNLASTTLGGLCPVGDTCAMTGATINLSATATGTVGFYDSTYLLPRAGGGILKQLGTSAGAAIQLFSPDATSLLAAATQGIPANQTIPSGTPPTSPSYTLTLTTATGTASETVPSIDFSFYLGTGSVTTLANTDFTYATVNGNNAQSLVAISTTGNIGDIPNISASALATITYSYSATPTGVPEPTSLALLGTGLVGLGGAIRRRRAARKA